MITFILSCVNAGFFGGASATPMVLGLAIFYGGLVQLLAGMWAFRRGETFVAVTLTATYLFLVLAEFGINPADLQPIAGYIGITCGVAAWYVAFAHVTNATFGRELIPTWPLR